VGVSERVARALVLAGCLLGACSGPKPRPPEDARASTPRPDATDATARAGSAAAPVAVDAAPVRPAPTTGDLQVRVEWRDVPVAVRASPGLTPCRTPRTAAVAPTTTWGIPDVVVLVEGMAPEAEQRARVVLADCALSRRVVTGSTVRVESGVDHPARLTVAKRGTLAALGTLAKGTPRALQLPIAGHAVALALDDGAVYELATDGKDPETAWLVAAPAAVTDASGQVIVRDLAPGAHAITAWLPPRGGAPAKLARGTVTVEAGDLATITLDLAAR